MQRYIYYLVCLAASCTLSATTDYRSPRRIETPDRHHSSKKDQLITHAQEAIERLSDQLKEGCRQKKDGSYKAKHKKKKHKKKKSKTSNINCREAYHRLLLATGYLQGLQDVH